MVEQNVFQNDGEIPLDRVTEVHTRYARALGWGKRFRSAVPT